MVTHTAYRVLERTIQVEQIALIVLRKHELRRLVVGRTLVAVGEEQVDHILHQLLPHSLHARHYHFRKHVAQLKRHNGIPVAVFKNRSCLTLPAYSFACPLGTSCSTHGYASRRTA